MIGRVKPPMAGAANTTTTSGAETPSLGEIQAWCEPRMAQYKTPTKLLWLDEIPKNAMGKVNKKELLHLFSQQETNRLGTQPIKSE